MKIWTGQDVPRIGMGCWAIGGPTANEGPSTSYGRVDDARSRRALNLGYDLGARLFDTAAGYGAGHSEVLIGEEISRHEDVVIVTKFGFAVDEEAGLNGPEAVDDAGIRATIDGSRRRLRRDRLDLALFHLNGFPPEEAGPVFDTLEALVAEGKIAAFGWSTDFVDSARAVCDRAGFVAIENDYNVFTPATDLMKLAGERDLVAISRLPLAMGLLTGKFRAGQSVGSSDVRGAGHDWLRFFTNGEPNADYLERMEALRGLLTSGGRSLAQGALGWILAASPVALPVPGFKTEDQVRDNLGALEKGSLPADIMGEIDKVLRGFAPV